MKDRKYIIALVQKLIDADGTEEELRSMIVELRGLVPDPYVTDYIFATNPQMPASEVVDKAFSYVTIQLPLDGFNSAT